jgi:hypothetical protein
MPLEITLEVGTPQPVDVIASVMRGPAGPAGTTGPTGPNFTEFDAPSFGATGDGATDDTAAIQAALDAAKAAGGGIVYLPPGTYNVSTNMGLTSATGVIIRGAGMGATRIVDTRPAGVLRGIDPWGFGLLSFYASDRCGIEDLSLIGPLVLATLVGPNSSDGGAKATFQRNCTRSWVRRVEARGFEDEGIYADATTLGPPEYGAGWWCEDNWIHTTRSNAINYNINGPVAGRQQVIANNIIRNCYHSPILFGGGSIICVNNDISGPDVTMGAVVIGIDAATRAVVANNVIHDLDCSAGGVSIIGVGGTYNGQTHVTIAHNVMVEVKATLEQPAPDGGAAIGLGDCHSATIVGNAIINCGREPAFGDARAIVVTGANSNNCYIAGNVVVKGARNIVTGVEVRAPYPDGAAFIGENDFTDCTIPYDLNAATRGRGVGSPEAVIVGNVGDTYINVSGGAGTTFYIKESGAGTDTGWAAK